MTLVTEKALTLGTSSVTFDGLKNGTVYRYVIIACYDNFTGENVGFHILSGQALRTNNIVLFDNIVIGKESITFTIKQDDSVANKMPISLKLYKNATLIRKFDTSATEISQLLSNSEYLLVA